VITPILWEIQAHGTASPGVVFGAVLSYTPAASQVWLSPLGWPLRAPGLPTHWLGARSSQDR
jgi:hypothetical protein